MEIERACFGRMAYSRGLFRELHAAAGGLFLVARLGRAIAGYAVGSVEGGEAEIVSIAVDPAARREHVGTALMAALLDQSAGRGAKRAVLMVRAENQPALRFYRGFGFRRVRLVEGYYEDGAAGWLMRRTL